MVILCNLSIRDIREKSVIYYKWKKAFPSTTRPPGRSDKTVCFEWYFLFLGMFVCEVCENIFVL